MGPAVLPPVQLKQGTDLCQLNGIGSTMERDNSKCDMDPQETSHISTTIPLHP